MIQIIDNSNNNYRLLHSSSILLLNIDDKINIDVVDSTTNSMYKFHFIFSDQGKELTADISAIENNQVFITLYKWNGNPPIENSTPVILDTDQGNKLLIKFKTSSEENRREFLVSIWTEEN